MSSLIPDICKIPLAGKIQYQRQTYVYVRLVTCATCPTSVADENVAYTYEGPEKGRSV